MSARRSRDKIDVNVEMVRTADGEKPWAVVRDRRRGGAIVLVPSFEDLHRIIMAIVHCERTKYRDRSADPSRMVRAFFSRSIDVSVAALDEAKEGVVSREQYERTWAKLAAEFRMPPETYSGGLSAESSDLDKGCVMGCECELCAEWPLEGRRT